MTKTRQDKTRQDKTRQDKTRQDKTTTQHKDNKVEKKMKTRKVGKKNEEKYK